ncbi:MAG: hypothetical protein ACKVP4_11720 [Hyphomicrobium sp.]
MDDPEAFEPGDHVFTGTITTWNANFGELLTDSGVSVPLLTQGVTRMRVGARVTILARKLRPRFVIQRVDAV